MQESNEYKWYTLRVFTNQEFKVKEAIQKKIQQQTAENFFGEIFIPTEQARKHLPSGKTVAHTKTSFPGYIFINMKMCDRAFNIVRSTSKVTGFVGGEYPATIKEAEIEAMRNRTAGSVFKPKAKIDFGVGDEVKITTGAFQNFSGKVREFNTDNSKAKLDINIFGRETSVEISVNDLAAH